MDQKPSVGRIVHYTPGAPDNPPAGAMGPWAAIITWVSRDESRSDVNLAAFDSRGAPLAAQGVAYSETPKPGHWSWPPRV